MKCWVSHNGWRWCLLGLMLLSGIGQGVRAEAPAPVPAQGEAEFSHALPSHLLHAESLQPDTLPADFPVAEYWVSEKLDGVRAVWDGRQLWFRSGLPLMAPRWFTQSLPPQALDGELWIARGQFERLSGVVRQNPPDDQAWQAVKYMLFDLPAASGSFSERIAAMQHLTYQVGVNHLQMIEQQRVTSPEALKNLLDEVMKRGGEGLMLHRADAVYRAGRHADLLKFKPRQDAEAVVIAHLPGQGRNAGKLGALRVRLPDGREFNIGSGLTDAQRASPPPLGAAITYRYRGFTRTGLPRFATLLRVRDLP